MISLPNIAIVTTTNDGVSDTFIKAHLERLKGQRYGFYGLPMPVRPVDGDKTTLTVPKWKRILPAFLYDRIKKTVITPENIIEFHFQKKKIDVVLAEYGPTGAKLLPVCRKLGIPLIVHFHGHDATRESIIKAFAEKYHEMFRYAASIISVSNAMTSQLVALGAPIEKVIYNPYGPNERFLKLHPPFIQDGYFLFVGRFVEKKAPQLTLLAFQKVLSQFPQARLVMIGDGPLLPICRQLAKALGINNVEFMGTMKPLEIAPFFENAFCYVQHSVIASDGDSEGTPVSILEAGAASLPIIATRHAGIPEAVLHNQTGYLVEEGDVSGMADYMKTLYADRDLCRQLGENARRHITKNYSIERHLGILDTEINKALNNR
ncbi:MAG: glycosyltransferase [Crocinitomicaceae bacterium]|nr:glycosyltransferase [Crocinitomicaceae bacterium]